MVVKILKMYEVMMVILWDILEQIVRPDILCQLRILKQDIFSLEDLYIFLQTQQK